MLLKSKHSRKNTIAVLRAFPQDSLESMSNIRKDRVKWFFEQTQGRIPLEDAEIVLTYRFSKEQLLEAKALKWIQISSSGWEHLPADELREAGVQVSNVAGIAEREVAHYLALAVLTLSRRMLENYRNQAGCRWERIPASSVVNKNLLFLGTGKISRAAVGLLTSLGLNCYGINRSEKATEPFLRVYKKKDLIRLLPDMDYLVNALPETEETVGMIGSREINVMKKTSAVIQVGRAKVIDEKALFQALNDKRIGQAMIDVHWLEPIPSRHAWHTLGNVVLTPHIAAFTEDYDHKIVELFRSNLERYLAGESLVNRVI